MIASSLGAIDSIGNLLCFIHIIGKDTNGVGLDVSCLAEGRIVTVHFMDVQWVLLAEPFDNVKCAPVNEVNVIHIYALNQINGFHKELVECNVAIVLSYKIDILVCKVSQMVSCATLFAPRGVPGCISQIDKLDIVQMHVQDEERSNEDKAHVV